MQVNLVYFHIILVELYVLKIKELQNFVLVIINKRVYKLCRDTVKLLRKQVFINALINNKLKKRQEELIRDSFKRER